MALNHLKTLLRRVPGLADAVGRTRRLLGMSRMQVFSITTYRGDQPWSVAPITTEPAQVLTRDDVTDVPAAFVADPFLHRSRDGWFLFFEVLRSDTSRGVIAVATSPDGLRWEYGGVVLAEPFHLSYPHVLEIDGEVFMIPESFEAEAVRLYRATSFPSRWVFDRELLVGEHYADASPFVHGGSWWMFTETSRKSGVPTGAPPRNTLRLYGAPSIKGPWTEHPMSPIVVDDARIGRPAGRVVSSNGRLIRFAQESTDVYGLQVHALEIEELTATTYRERPMFGDAVLGPGRDWWNRGGMHHIDAHPVEGGWLASVDGWSMQREPRPRRRLP